jgi:CheY-like chemotaxis protein
MKPGRSAPELRREIRVRDCHFVSASVTMKGVAAHGTILVVDDDDDTRNCVHAVLQAEGYEVLAARNGREALQLLRGGLRPSLVLLDLMMPILSGWEVLEAIDGVPDLARVPVVVFTAAGEPVAREPLLNRPILRKPIDLDLLLEMVGKLCAAGWMIDEPPSDLLPKHS